MRADIVNIFPDALPKDELLFPLVQFFAEAVYTLPVENSPLGPAELPPLTGSLLAQGLLRFHYPAPLGAERERFLSLLEALRQRPGDYAALALTGGREAESKNTIISAVRRQQAGQKGSADADGRAAALWQARLVLKLAELAERQEEEIRQSLRRIASREQEIFRTLRDMDSLSSQGPAETEPPDSRRTRLRLKAWRTLNSLGSPPPAGAFVAADQDAFELLVEECGEARAVVAVPLPAVLAGEDFAAKRTAFRQAAADFLTNLPTSFDEKAWNLLLEQHYPAERHGRRKLLLHFLPNAALFGGTAEEAILGILKQAEQQ
jgi:hypothetical protein